MCYSLLYVTYVNIFLNFYFDISRVHSSSVGFFSNCHQSPKKNSGISTGKNSRVSEPAQFKLVVFQGQLYTIFKTCVLWPPFPSSLGPNVLWAFAARETIMPMIFNQPVSPSFPALRLTKGNETIFLFFSFSIVTADTPSPSVIDSWDSLRTGSSLRAKTLF